MNNLLSLSLWVSCDTNYVKIKTLCKCKYVYHCIKSKKIMKNLNNKFENDARSFLFI